MKKIFVLLAMIIIIIGMYGCATTLSTTKTEWTPELVTPQLKEGFLLQDIKTKPFSFGNGLSLNGKIVNNSGKDYDKAIFSICIYDDNGNILNTNSFSIRSFKAGQTRKLSSFGGGTYISGDVSYINIKKFEVIFGKKKITENKQSSGESLSKLLKSSHYKGAVFFDELVKKRKQDKKLYDANYDIVFNSLIEIMSDVGNPIINMDRENGLILTDFERRSTMWETWQDKYFIRVSKPSEKQVQVGIKRTVRKKEGRDTWKDKASDGVIEKWILNNIQQRIEADK